MYVLFVEWKLLNSVFLQYVSMVTWSPLCLYPDVPPVIKPLVVRHPRLKQWLNSGSKEGGGHKSFTVQCDDGRLSVTMDQNILQVSIYPVILQKYHAEQITWVCQNLFQLKTYVIKTFIIILYDINIIPVAPKFKKNKIMWSHISSLLQNLSVSVTAVTLQDSRCQAQSNGSHFLLVFPVLSCGTEGLLLGQPRGVQYKNMVRWEIGAESDYTQWTPS